METFTLNLKNGNSVIFENYKLFDIEGHEPSNYKTAKYKDYSDIVEIYENDCAGRSIKVSDVISIQLC